MSRMAHEQKTRPTDVSPVDYCATLPTERRRSEGARLLAIFGDITGADAVMWGPSMIGYGSDTYAYASGHSGTWFRVGFAPRKAALSLYGLPSLEDAPELYSALGKHRRSVGCVYVNGLKDIDHDVLGELIRAGWENPREAC